MQALSDSRVFGSIPRPPSSGRATAAGIAALVCWLFLHQWPAQGTWILTLAVVALALPVALSGCYLATIAAARRAKFLRNGSAMHWFVSRRALSMIAWVVAAVCSSFVVVLQFQFYTRVEWAWFFLAMGLYLLVARLARPLVRRQFVDLVTEAAVLRFARWISLGLLAIAGAVYYWYTGRPEGVGGLAANIEARRAVLQSDAYGSFIDLVLDGIVHVAALRGHSLDRVFDLHHWAGVALTITFALLGPASAVAIISALQVPLAEYGRVFAPLSTSDQAPPLRVRRLVLTIGGAALLAVVALASVMEIIEDWLAGYQVEVEYGQAWVARKVVQIDDQYYGPAVLVEIDAVKAEYSRMSELANARLAEAAR